MQKPSVGRVVHYVSYGTPGGEYQSQCRAAIVTETTPSLYETAPAIDDDTVSLAVLNPTGMFFNQAVAFDDSERPKGGTWHWPERVD